MKRAFLAAALASSFLLAAPSAAQSGTPKVPSGFFGATWDGPASTAAEEEQERQFALMARSGVESVRVVFRWAEIERAPLVYDFEHADRLVSLAVRHGRRVLPVVLYPPEFSKTEPGVEGSPPRDPQDLARLMRELVRRFGPNGTFWLLHPELPRRPLREWQIWNEPHLDGYWKAPGGDWATGYTALLAAAHAAVKDEDPGARIVLAALADFSWRHLTRLYSAGAQGRFDVAAVNLYTSRPEFVIKGLRRFRRAMNRRDPRKQIYLTEVGWPASLGRIPRPAARWQRAWETTDRGLARRVSRFLGLAATRRRALRLARVYWYNWASTYRPGSIFNFMGLTRFDGERVRAKPALRAFRAGARRYGR
ncbi:MAG TPA: hypothetical protein VHG69_08250 [Thermoleophilaceae bacterium]|nr:hypothetical protein [Thermoleophilaceae bacterium]